MNAHNRYDYGGSNVEETWHPLSPVGAPFSILQYQRERTKRKKACYSASLLTVPKIRHFESIAVKEILSILFGFLPWIAFGAISGPSAGRLNTAIVVALLLVVLTGFRQLWKGFILTWGSLLFFACGLIIVVIWKNPWVIGHLDILAHATLALIAWISIAVRKPFVLQYARETVPAERQAAPLFYMICRNLSIMWGVVFLLNTLMSIAKSSGCFPAGAGLQVASYSLIGLGFFLNHWYPKYVVSRLKASGSPNVEQN